jgi:hypothetical protein
MKLISNKHLSSISYMKCRYVDGKYMHFMTVNNHVIQEGDGSISIRGTIALLLFNEDNKRMIIHIQSGLIDVEFSK